MIPPVTRMATSFGLSPFTDWLGWPCWSGWSDLPGSFGYTFFWTQCWRLRERGDNTLQVKPIIWPNQTRQQAVLSGYVVKKPQVYFLPPAGASALLDRVRPTNLLYLVVDNLLHSLLLLHSSPAVAWWEKGVKRDQDADDLFRVSFGVKNGGQNRRKSRKCSRAALVTCQISSPESVQDWQGSMCWQCQDCQCQVWNQMWKSWGETFQHGGTSSMCADVLGRWTNVIFDARRAWWPWPHS